MQSVELHEKLGRARRGLLARENKACQRWREYFKDVVDDSGVGGAALAQ